jgi:hypothetical protein
MSIKETQGRQKRKHRVPKVVECLNFMYSLEFYPLILQRWEFLIFIQKSIIRNGRVPGSKSEALSSIPNKAKKGKKRKA